VKRNRSVNGKVVVKVVLLIWLICGEGWDVVGRTGRWVDRDGSCDARSLFVELRDVVRCTSIRMCYQWFDHLPSTNNLKLC